MTAAWLDRVLAAGAVLDLHHPDARADLAERILDAMPCERIVDAIELSTIVVLAQKHARIVGASDREDLDQTKILREVARNCAQSVLAAMDGE